MSAGAWFPSLAFGRRTTLATTPYPRVIATESRPVSTTEATCEDVTRSHFAGVSPSGLAVGDLDGANGLDLVVGASDNDQNAVSRVFVLYNQGGGTFGERELVYPDGSGVIVRPDGTRARLPGESRTPTAPSTPSRCRRR